MSKRLKLIMPLLFIVVALSCKPIYSSVNGVNKDINFKSSEQFKQYFSTNYGLDTSKIYFADNNKITNLYYYIASQKVSYLYGIMINDTTKIVDPYLSQSKSCASRIKTTLSNNPLQYPTTSSRIKEFGFRTSEGDLLSLNGRQTYLFILSTKSGKAINRTIKDLCAEIEKQNNPTIDYCLLSIDLGYRPE